MNKKQHYIAPEVEMVGITLENHLLSGSLISGTQSKTSGVSAEGMDAEDLSW